MSQLYSVHIDSPVQPNGHWQSEEIVCQTLEDATKIADYIRASGSGWTVEDVAPTVSTPAYTYDTYLQEQNNATRNARH